ncbi:20b909a4-65e1-46bc-97d0-45cf5a54e1f7 [Thermothielavioides terrestris]|uniref:20b909a4-65e1-46bc-97d0-45cf5a54e1f7 n=1 Tax=Thermothielavioides terrestris TaxID=2587410 RepID=A0A446BD90_9PEZI|nr:20b909a4-65e1-46bc-97d0-45cf5a54e1f7 [Thermothielavioides terrestris]
MSSSKASLF